MLRGAVVMSGNRQEQTKMELSIFRQRRSIPFRSRLRLDYSVSGLRSAQVTSTKNAGDNCLEMGGARNDRRPGVRPRFQRFHVCVHCLVDRVLIGRIDPSAAVLR